MKKLLVPCILITLTTVALAQSDPTPQPPDSISQIMTYLETAQYLPAVGAALVLIVGSLRALLSKKFAWFQTQIGGYVLSYVSTVGIYVGTAMEEHQAITIKLLLSALAAALGAAGVLDHFRDAKIAVAKKSNLPPGSGTTVAALLIVLLTIPSCGTNCKDPANAHSAECNVENALIECTGISSIPSAVTALAPQFASMVDGAKQADGSIDWASVAAQSEKLGVEWGMCTLAQVWDDYFGSSGRTKLTPKDAKARETFDKVRGKIAPHYSFKTKGGVL